MNKQPNVLDWGVEELATLNLGDERRNQRLRLLVSQLAPQPAASLPQALPDQAALKAAYRFFDNTGFEEQDIIASHLLQTYQRCHQVALVLAVQDTSEIDYTEHYATTGLGHLATAKQRGLLLHTTIAFTADGLPLGLLGQQQWSRDLAQLGKRARRKQLPISEKESNKWLVGLQSTNLAAAQAADTRFIAVADREADIYELLAAPREANCELLIRACRIRNVAGGEHLYESVAQTQPVARVVVQVPARNHKPARQAELAVRYHQVELKPTSRKQAALSLYAVLAEELAPPSKAEAVSWLLLTTMPLQSSNDALQMLEWYSVRWGIEVWHKVLKSGCKVEQRQPADFERLVRMIAVYSLVAWRVQYATMLARSGPEMSCEVVLERAEWEALYCAVHRVAMPPRGAPSLAQAIHWLGQLGGFSGRKSDGEPGVTSIWRGLQRLRDLTTMYVIMRPPGDVGKD
ncbi:MAG: IS4 family transposase [Candidatus Chloroheliales bacterium]|nr:MAG: IS4 family transposase [Chloroflexota bacterium]